MLWTFGFLKWTKFVNADIKKGKNSIQYDLKAGFFDLWIKKKVNEIIILKSHKFYFDGCFSYIYIVLSTRFVKKVKSND